MAATDEWGTMFIERATNLDCAVFEPALGIIGQSWHVDVSLSGPLDHQGFVYDFSKLKKLAREVLKESMDHSLVIPISSKEVHFEADGENELWQLHARCRMNDVDCQWEYRCPPGAVYPIRAVTIRRESIEQELSRLLRHRLPETVQGVEITLREQVAEPTAAFFRYTHGITQHEGLCQRLFHGHRSRVEVFVGDERRPDLEHYIARQVLGTNVHICCPAQLQTGNIDIGMRGKAGESITLGYTAGLGIFQAKLPAEMVFMVAGETSIECISQQLAQMIARSEAASAGEIYVKVYEGIDKGAVAVR